MRVSPYGLEATIVDELAPGAAASLFDVVTNACAAAGVTVRDVIPASCSLVVTHDAVHSTIVQQLLSDTCASPLVDHEGLSVSSGITVIPVCYDGVDLHTVAHLTGLSVDRVIALHSSAVYTVEFCGFSPGFSYLRGLPHELQIARRSSPRTRVPPGSVAIAALYSAVYPSESPGGWHLIGTTSARMWDTERNPPALLQPGATVRFVSTQ